MGTCDTNFSVFPDLGYHCIAPPKFAPDKINHVANSGFAMVDRGAGVPFHWTQISFCATPTTQHFRPEMNSSKNYVSKIMVLRRDGKRTKIER